MNLPRYVKSVLACLERAGVPAYVVGGAVRDLLLGCRPGDYDIAADAPPAQLKSIFSSFKTFDTGIRFGTVGVLCQGKVVEVTSFRRDGVYLDVRHPVSVRFTDDLTQDLARRDFTINAMAMAADGEVIDPFGGAADLKAGVVRAVGDPEQRFSEDALRILRGARFCSRFGFDMDEATKTAAFRLAPKLAEISAERLRDELLKLLAGDDAARVLLDYDEIVFSVIPELRACKGFDQHNPNHHLDVWGHIALTVRRVDKKQVLRMAALLHDVAKPRCFSMEGTRGRFWGHMEASAVDARVILERLHCPAKFTNTVCTLVEYHDKPYQATPADARRWLSVLGVENTYLVIRLKYADCLAHDRSYHRHLPRLRGFKAEVDAALRRHDCYCLSMLAVNGRDVNRALGWAPSDRTGVLLRALLDAVIDGSVANEREPLLRLAKELGDLPFQKEGEKKL
ncbi:MAG: HD domain-containing protein [Oscillospiraceae bacterium]|nr:HD domain-containing protein [Oscillospiraceae bacterium]